VRPVEGTEPALKSEWTALDALDAQRRYSENIIEREKII
jgi:hypothetical protein